MITKSLPKTLQTALLAGGIITAITFAPMPIAWADKSGKVLACTNAGSSLKDCCEKAGGSYSTTVSNGHTIEACTIAEVNKAVIKDPDGRLRIAEVDGNNSPLPTRATIAPPPPGATNKN
jgi:hypothetical protein